MKFGNGAKKKEVPSDQDEAFVLRHHVEAEFQNTEDQCLKVVLSTPRLLKSMTKRKMVQIDAAYKLNWQGFSVMVVGIRDCSNVFYPFTIALCNGESSDDFAFIF